MGVRRHVIGGRPNGSPQFYQSLKSRGRLRPPRPRCARIILAAETKCFSKGMQALACTHAHTSRGVSVLSGWMDLDKNFHIMQGA